ncbi:GNAT family N-acetyltransferase [Halomonas sp. MCCC 1A17488]|uniref:GNAT family N-acetyltransferase n=2 Tax=Billgrantia sulfidoxydans TaxID=2733484 RepID=A0ABX7WA21_9GAMM|nr:MULTISPECIES: GNAT family N-acetyltransferase [unclassified Halomonas]MCE8017857.1 GNAT family N-acetyltransferase [Halomonas sp. MCCC 1A17488]MCG3241190.1 GNAT family N-acetyltransferase [Halomonas sp. MCCC 1A17488]QPP49040.1 GNAT family N-acetyltransferase [Halomonas sp. SS10-MC5]QTP57188.1 GNAT family N-acetyltransferase [Halomonas sulfidoxydans]
METAALVALRHMEVNVKRRLRLRPAAATDRPLLEHWDTQSHVFATPSAGGNRHAELGHHAEWRRQFIAERDGYPIGFVQIIAPAREQSAYWGELAPGVRAIDLWIGEPEELGKGYGTTTIQLALALCFADPEVFAVQIAVLADNRRVRHFYERLGFRFIEQRGLGNVTGCIYRLERRDWQA